MQLHRNVRLVVDAARAAGLEIEPRSFDTSTRTAADAAAAIGVRLGQIVKSLVFAVDGDAVVALVPGDRQLDEAKLAGAAGGITATRLDADAVREATGFPVGGIPPLGHARPLRVFCDEGLLTYDEVWAAAGMPHVNFSVAPERLVEVTHAVVCRLSR